MRKKQLWSMIKRNVVFLSDFFIILSYSTIFNGIMNKYLRLNTRFIILISKERSHVECLSYPLRLKSMDQVTRVSNYVMKLISLMKPFNISGLMSFSRTMKFKDPQIKLLCTYLCFYLICSSWQKICTSKSNAEKMNPMQGNDYLKWYQLKFPSQKIKVISCQSCWKMALSMKDNFILNI